MMTYKSFFILIFSLFILSCQKENSSENQQYNNLKSFEVSISANNHLRADVTATFSENTSFCIAYWEVNNPSKIKKTKIYKASGKTNKTIIFLKPETEYACKIIYGNELSSEIKTFKTKEVQSFLPKATLEKDELKEPLDGYFLTNLRNPKAIYIMDTQGVIIWYELIPEGVLVVNYDLRTEHLYMLTQPTHPVGSTFTFNGNGVKIIDLFGNIIFQKDLSTLPEMSNRQAHHECRPMPDGSIGLVTYVDKTFDLSLQGGSSSENVKGDGFIILNLKGEVTHQWDFFPYLSPLNDSNIMNIKNDCLHANSLNYDNEGNYYMTLNRYSELWKIDKKTNSLKYRIGESGTIKPNEKYFSHGMHCANPIAPNEVLVIDNARNNQNTGSRALVFRVNEHSQSVDVPLMVSLPKGVFSGNRSNAQFINNDLILFALSTERNIIITNKNENPEIKRQISLTNTFYRIQYIPDIQY